MLDSFIIVSQTPSEEPSNFPDLDTEFSMYNYRHRKGFSPQRAIASIAKSSAVLMSSVLAYSSKHLAAVTPDGDISTIVTSTHFSTLKAVKTSLSSWDSISPLPPDVVMSVCGMLLARIEIKPLGTNSKYLEIPYATDDNVNEEIFIHIRGLRAMLMASDDWMLQKQTPIISWILFW
jgi:hypothetical protein